VPTARFENRATVGTTRPPDARAVAAEDVAEVLKLRSASSVGQQVFMRNVGEAESELRKIIGRAQESVCIVDPYLGPNELLVYGLANGNLGVHIELLTSAAFLRDADRGTAANLLSTLERIQGHQLVNPIEIRVAGGERSPIHDRFVVTDGRVWLVGSSLSELGSRGTVVVQLQNPEPVIALIRQVWDNESTSVREFVDNRAAQGGKEK
jgi:phosphatidylserine/phosphatidylglycerophosphate/cardiolipin synthase-like enzyme